jgi:hypothetical protein
MTFEEACIEAVSGRDMTAAHLQPGCHLSYEFGANAGFRRTWPNGDNCTFIANEADEAADWFEYVKPVEPPKWGTAAKTEPAKPVEADPMDAIAAALAAKKAREAEKLAPALSPVAATVGWGNPLPPPVERNGETFEECQAPAPSRDAWGRPVS